MKKFIFIFLGVLIFVIILFNLFFRIVISNNNEMPNTDCIVVINRFTHSYYGTIDRNCNYSDCRIIDVSGKLTDQDIVELNKQIRVSKNKTAGSYVCDVFDK